MNILPQANIYNYIITPENIYWESADCGTKVDPMVRLQYWIPEKRLDRTLQSILANLNNAVAFIVSIRPLISTSPFINPIVAVMSALITTAITVPFLFHSFFSVLLQSPVFLSLFTFFQFYPVTSRDAKVHYSDGLLLLWLAITRYRHLVKITWSVFNLKIPENFMCLIL